MSNDKKDDIPTHMKPQNVAATAAMKNLRMVFGNLECAIQILAPFQPARPLIGKEPSLLEVIFHVAVGCHTGLVKECELRDLMKFIDPPPPPDNGNRASMNLLKGGE